MDISSAQCEDWSCLQIQLQQLEAKGEGRYDVESKSDDADDADCDAMATMSRGD